MENQPGNGATSPFGNGNGATSGGASSGAHDFIRDPKSNSPSTGGHDFTKENRPQKAGDNGANPASVPTGGKTPFVAPGATESRHPLGSEKKPFRLNGEGPAPEESPEVGSVPDEDF